MGGARRGQRTTPVVMFSIHETLQRRTMPAMAIHIHIRSARRTRVSAAVLLLSALFTLAPEGAAGQGRVRPRTAIADSLSYRIATFSPSNGPPGTPVVVSWQYLPARTPMRIGVGAQRIGFEALKEILSDDSGEFADVTIKIPEWARSNRPVHLIMFDFYFNPLAISSAFHVTDGNGMLVRAGRLQEARGSCAELLSNENQLYWLTGDTGAFQPGDRVVVQAKLADPAACGRGERDVVLQVAGVRRAIGS